MNAGTSYLIPSPLIPTPLLAPGLTPASTALQAPGTSFQRVQLWQLIVAQLDLAQGGYSCREIAELFGMTTEAVTKWCRRLFPKEEGGKRTVYWLEFSQVVELIIKICKNGRGLPNQSDLYRQLLEHGDITPRFPSDNAAVLAAEKYLANKRLALLKG